MDKLLEWLTEGNRLQKLLSGFVLWIIVIAKQILGYISAIIALFVYFFLLLIGLFIPLFVLYLFVILLARII